MFIPAFLKLTSMILVTESFHFSGLVAFFHKHKEGCATKNVICFQNFVLIKSKLSNLGCNQDGVIVEHGIVSHRLQEEKPWDSFPRSMLTNSMGTSPNILKSGLTCF